MKTILTEQQINLTIQRLAHQIYENHLQLHNTVLIGMQPRGILLSDKIVTALSLIDANVVPQYGKLDITFYRDDVRKELHVANATTIPFTIENKQVILIDDVLWTGRSIRAAFDALLDFGRPNKVELCVLIDRRFSREFPIQPNYVGKTIDSQPNEKVYVQWQEKHGNTAVIID